MSLYPSRTINDLPEEILIEIFQYVYLATANLDLELGSSQGLADPSLFPGCITKVCKKWKKLIRSIPHFSTRVIIFVDEPISLSSLQDRFSVSKTLLIKVFVVRKDYEATEDTLEKGRIKEAMKALVPHVTRCQVVVFDVLHDSSLPRITYFSGKAAKLRTLRMKSRQYGTAVPYISQQPTPSLRPNPKAFLCPRLQYLDLDGRVFVMAMSIEGWAESIRMLTKKRLTVCNLSPLADFNLDDLLTALSQLGHLTELKLSNVELDIPSNIGGSFSPLFIQNFELEGLKRNFLGGFFNHHYNKIDVSRIILDNCELGLIDHLASWHLILRTFKGRRYHRICQAVERFGLHIENCPGLDDSLIIALSNFCPSKDAFFANTLRQLGIVSSGPVSVKAIKIDESELENIGLGACAPQSQSPPTSSKLTQPATTPSSPLLSGDYSLMAWSIEDLEMIDAQGPPPTVTLLKGVETEI
ncbi:hypothetical protein CPB84DRAFT_1961562 [Gymnopilus junonius]|uniref:F-box domain-containing protein n=1 Tax=Gymnopilus junonius TaxID=109634 RepID=A0A9P5TNE0_GYMJU|nr:hypothetical protein CPB84DRAFT_1961562 [Gymnopilus junonius]